ncbi:hypothetical protein ACT3SQ_00295 [Brachybacterium sp. AOP42-C2-15]|uniref:hypothetical protein n=1 Tax=unclassified Brachybacterium TaxID=2623841 RepID=UPI003F8F678B
MNALANGSKRTVHPVDQPLKPATALVITSVLMVLALAGTYLLTMLPTDDAAEKMMTGEIAPQLIVTAVIALVLVVGMLGLGLASFVLAIVVVVKGGGKLRLGAGLMIAASLFGLFISFSVSGDTSQLPDAAVAVSNVFSVLEVIVEVIRGVVMIAGVVILILGIREVRRERAELPAR